MYRTRRAILKILVTGANGQLGSELKALSKEFDYEFFFTSKDELDICNVQNLENYAKNKAITHIINCAAYTAVDKAETSKDLANNINNLGVKNLAQISKDLRISLVHISTDYVFNGKNFKPYTETDVPDPKGVYAQTKLDGERAMQEINPANSIILRTSWVYSIYGNNFVKTMIKLATQRQELNVVFDQIGTPTHAKSLAKTILKIMPCLANKEVEIYHYSNEGVCSWYDFAKEIMDIYKLSCKIQPIHTSEYPTPAKRPHYSVLDKTKIKNEFNIKISHWKDELKICLKNIKGANNE